MGSIGTTTTDGEHKRYLQNERFNNLDEYDEQIAHDSTVEIPRKSEVQNELVEGRLRVMERTAKTVDVDSREGTAFENSVKAALDKTNNPEQRKRLRAILDSLEAERRFR